MAGRQAGGQAGRWAGGQAGGQAVKCQPTHLPIHSPVAGTVLAFGCPLPLLLLLRLLLLLPPPRLVPLPTLRHNSSNLTADANTHDLMNHIGGYGYDDG